MKKLAFLLFFIPGSLFASSQLTVNGSVMTLNGANVTLQGINRGPASVVPSYVLVQSSCTARSKAEPLSLTYNSSFTANHTEIIFLVDPGDAMGTNDVVDTGKNKITQYPVNAFGDGNAKGAFYVSTNTQNGGAMTVTADLAGTGANLSMCITEWSGVSSVISSSSTLATSANVNTGTATFSGASALAVGLMTHSTGGTPTLTEINSEILIGEDENNSADQAYSAVYKILGSTKESMRWTAGASIAWKAGMLVLQ